MTSRKELALDAVLELVGAIDSESAALGLDLSDDDFDRGWHGARRDVANQIRATIEKALKADDA